ncbi:MAG TPA: RsmD family RNA methyltransferase [Candidatus Saccharimonadales bacterium]|nr:RsmD family RNA methyltransferase [Candidatus Saccharimonadales bacterium]
MKQPKVETIKLDKIVGGGQALGVLKSGKKAFVWGGLPGETVEARLTKKKSSYAEAVVEQVIEPSPQRIEPKDEAYLSTSPWQIMDFDAEQHYKSALIEEAFELHDIVLPGPITVFSDNQTYNYRNKIEFSFWWDNEEEQLDLAFFRRGTKGKIPVDGTSLARPEINQLAIAVRDLLRAKKVEARDLKTLMIRSSQADRVVFQLYVKDEKCQPLAEADFKALPAIGGQVIYSDPKSPASKVTRVLASFGQTKLTDKLLDHEFGYVVNGFFQVNLPVYEQALMDMKNYLSDRPLVDLYAGVGSIGLSIGPSGTTLVEVDEFAVKEMKNNIEASGSKATAVLAASEQALDYITTDKDVIVDPPRAGLHKKVIERLLEVKPPRIIYLSCNPVTQARDVALLAESYGIRAHQGYNFFPRTPHIEHLVVLDLKAL